MERIAGTHIEQMAIFPEMVTALSQGLLEPGGETGGLCPAGVTECDPMNIISPVGVGRLRAGDNMRARLREHWRQNNIIMAQDLDQQIIGYAREIYEYKQYLEANTSLTEDQIERELWSEIRGRIYSGVQAHEIGHTIGLRHNFAGSADALNYFPQYWTLRQKTFNEDCDGAGFRTFDPFGYAIGEVAPTGCDGDSPSAEEHAQLLAELHHGVVDADTNVRSINYYESSTVMDYHGEKNGREGGLGLYDYAAIAYAYTEMLEVFDGAPYKIAVRSTWDAEGNFEDSTTTRAGEFVTDMDDVENWSTRYGNDPEGDMPGDRERDNGWTYWHYSVLPMMFYDEAATIDDANVAMALDPAHFNFEGVGAMAGMYDRSLVSVSRLEDPNSNVPRFAESDIEVPYRFCSDFLRGASSLCSIFDSGADESEVVQRLISDYENYYPISWFRRGRTAFGIWVWPTISSLMNYTFDPAIGQYQHWLLRASGRGQGWYLNDHAGMAATIASQDAINFVSGVLATPTIGTYAPDSTADGLLINVDNEFGRRFPSYDPQFGEVTEDEYVEVGIADGGRYGYSQFLRNEDDEAGYYYFMQTEVLSHFWAKYAALWSFTNGSVEIVGADTSSDNTAFYIPPYLAYPDLVGNYFGAVFSEQFGNFGLCVTQDENGEHQIDNIDLIRSSSYRCDGAIMNPYTGAYGNRDFNMKFYTILFAASNFSANFDYDWLDHSSVYVWGRGEQPDIYVEETEVDPEEGSGEGDEEAEDTDPEGFEWLTYTDDHGITYAARVDVALGDAPDTWTDGRTNIGDDGYTQSPNVAWRMVMRAQDLAAERDAALADELDESTPYPVRDSGEIGYELDSHLEMIRFLVEINILYAI